MALRWVHLLLGGALLMPFFLLSGILVALLGDTGGVSAHGPAEQTLSFLVSLPLAAVAGLSGLVRPLSATAVRALCGVAPGRLADTPAESWSARWRTAGS
ncbi:hypothetical protein [Streptomyces sp. WMMC1477]|uniref:hypothetical protein n=1 Tax=Streptomyces sp. WMMC1477 TaxID=3015155 RepID=UPI002FC2C310